MPCPAPIQQLWHPGQRAWRSPESKLLPAWKVAKHSHSSRRTTSVFVLVEAKIIPQQGPNQVTFSIFRLWQLLQWWGDALPNETMASPLLILHHRGEICRALNTCVDVSLFSTTCGDHVDPQGNEHMCWCFCVFHNWWWPHWSAGQRTHVFMLFRCPQLVVTKLIRRATTESTRGREGQRGPGELCSRAQGQASSARLKSHRDTQIHFRIRHLKSNFRI